MADQSGYWPNNSNNSLSYIYPQPTIPGVGNNGVVTPGTATTVDPNAPGSTDDVPGSYVGVKKLNKYTGDIDNDDSSTTGDEDADTALQSTGLPHFTNSQLNDAAAQVQGTPGMQQLTNTMKSAASSPEASQNQLGAVASSASNLASTSNLNVWALLIIAFKGCVKDQNDQMQYDLSKLQMYSAMNTQMSQYGSVLESAQRALDAKQSAHSSQSNVQIEMDDQRDYNNFSTLDTNGVLHYTQTAEQHDAIDSSGTDYNSAYGKDHSKNKTNGNDYVSQPQDLQSLGQTGTNSWKYQIPNSNPPVTYTGYGANEGDARMNAWDQVQDHVAANDGANENNQGIKSNMVSGQTLNLKVQMYTQQMDQLQKLVTKWQNQYQSDSETKNQLISTITSILKNMYDMQSNGTRNLSL